jgi:hypothetical protein
MRVRWTGLGCLIGSLFGLAGCWTTDSHITKPPPPPAEYRIPPTDDPRFSQPPQYPEKTLNKGPKKGSDPMMPGSLRGPGSARYGGPGMGGY